MQLIHLVYALKEIRATGVEGKAFGSSKNSVVAFDSDFITNFIVKLSMGSLQYANPQLSAADLSCQTGKIISIPTPPHNFQSGFKFVVFYEPIGNSLTNF